MIYFYTLCTIQNDQLLLAIYLFSILNSVQVLYVYQLSTRLPQNKERSNCIHKIIAKQNAFSLLNSLILHTCGLKQPSYL